MNTAGRMFKCLKCGTGLAVAIKHLKQPRHRTETSPSGPFFFSQEIEVKMYTYVQLFHSLKYRCGLPIPTFGRLDLVEKWP